MKIKEFTIHRSVIELKAGELSLEEMATINVNVQRGHKIVCIVGNNGITHVTLEKMEEINRE